MLPSYMAFFWIFNALYAGQDLWRWGEEIGLPANRNWHGALLVATTPFLLLCIQRALSAKGVSKALILLAMTPPSLFSITVLYRCQSRGANLALAFAGILLAATVHIQSKRPFSTTFLKRVALWGSVSIFLAFSTVVLFFGDSIAQVIMRDVRIPLWGGAVSLFKHNPFLGVGAASYESHYVYHIPLAKFLRSWYYTERSDNPHNHFLYMLGSLGTLGVAATLYLWFYPIIHGLKNFGRLDGVTKLVLFAFIALTIHSMFDIVMSVWPTMYLALILQGLLWRECFFRDKKTEQQLILSPRQHSFVFFGIATSCVAAAIALSLFFVGWMIRQDAMGSAAERDAVLCYENGYFSIASREYDKAMRANCAPIYSYQAGMFSLLYLRDYRLALKYFNHLQSLPGNIIVHSNAHIANCLIHLNRRREALSYLYEELKVYPVSIIALHNILRLEKTLGLDIQAEKTAVRLLEALKFKGLTVGDIKLILEHPKFDGQFHLIKEYRNEK
ncbi:MAG: hypothetical protein GXP32_04830 [Kiritimatiellaeota bacterium]|nr:hypothetical protein [Kiritimatiellota bacterium]